MEFIVWILLIVLIYTFIGKLAFVFLDSIQRRNWGGLLLLICGFILTAMLSFVLFIELNKWTDAGSSYIAQHLPDKRLLAVIFILGFGIVWLWVQDMLFSNISHNSLSWQSHKRRKKLSRQIKLHLALITGALVFSVPFYWLVTTSLKPDERTNMFPPDLIPMRQSSVTIDGEKRLVYITDFDGRKVRVVKNSELPGGDWEVTFLGKNRVIRTIPAEQIKPDLHSVLIWKNYTDALKFLPPEYKMGIVPLWNTIYITLLVMFGTVLSSSLVAFAFARLRWPGRDLLFVIMLATMMIPAAVTMLPVFLIFRWLNWIDTLRPLWVTAFFGSGFNVFLLRQFFMTIPNDLEDAAKIDGCSYFRIYWNIMLPLIKPALAALTIFAFMGSWNNFMGPLIYISSPEKMTLAYALQLFQSSYGGEPGMMMAAATLVMIPVLAVFFFTQRYMIQGVTLTGIKG